MKIFSYSRLVATFFFMLLCGTGQAVEPLTFTLDRLKNDKSEVVTESSWGNKYLLIAIGYTTCPDVCPTTLLDIRNAIRALDKQPEKAALIQPLFISIDPLSDSLLSISRYASYFEPRIVGLYTNNFQQLNNVVDQLRGSYGYYYNDKPVMPPNLPKGYTVSHSTFVYLYSPDGMLVDIYPYNMAGDEMAKRILTNFP